LAISAWSTEPLPDRVTASLGGPQGRPVPAPPGEVEEGSINARQMIEESARKLCECLPLRHRMSMDTHRWQNNPIPIDFRGRIPVEAA
jgi:hypothetical protein